MEIDWFYSLSLLAFFLFCSAIFSGSEVALFSIDVKKLKELKKSGGLISHYIYELASAPRRLLVTILLGNTIFNVGASILAVASALKIAEQFQIEKDIILLLQIVVLTILVLLFGEITPKVIASKKPYQFSRFIAIPVYWSSVLIYPISKIITELLKGLSSRLKIDKSKTAILSSEISELADLSKEKGAIVDDEHELIHGLVEFKSITVKEIMTHRVDITSISTDSDFDEVIKIINDSGHSRIPLYKNSLDEIVGILYAKDLLPFLNDKEKQKSLSLKKIARRAIFIPEAKPISTLMREFQKRNMHIGIVVDEYGGTSGLITLEDILEEIVGDIKDEYDNEETEITPLKQNTEYLVLGKVPIDEINELLEEDLSSEEDDYDTIGGFVFNHIGAIPNEGDSFTYQRYEFIIKEVENNRVSKIIIKKIAKEKQ